MNRNYKAWGLFITITLALSATTLAQQSATQERDATQNQDAVQRQEVDQKQDDTQAKTGQLVRHEKLVGVDIHNKAGEKVGEVTDVVFELPSGQIHYVAASGENLVKAEDHLCAIPWEAFQVQFESGEEGEQRNIQHLTLQIDNQLVQQAPNFEEGGIWPSEISENFRSQVAKQVGEERVQRAFRPDEPGQQKSTQALRTKQLTDAKAFSQNNKEVGEVEDLFVDVRQGKVAFATIASGGFLGIGDDVSAVPLSAFEMKKHEDEVRAMLTITDEQLKQAPVMKDDKADLSMLHSEVQKFEQQHVKKGTETTTEDTTDEGTTNN